MNQILEELNKELEERVILEIQKNEDLLHDKETLQEKIDNLKKSLEGVQEKVETLKDEKQSLQIESSAIQQHKEDYSSLYKEYNKVVGEKQNQMKENMTYKQHGQEAFWDMIKWRIYFQSIPEDLMLKLKMEQFDSLKRLFVANDTIDIIQENLVVYYLMDQSLKE